MGSSPANKYLPVDVLQFEPLRHFGQTDSESHALTAVALPVVSAQPFEELQARDESALNRLLAASLPAEVESALKRGEDAIQETMAAIIASVPLIDATLEGAAKSTLGKLQHDITTLRGKVISAAKKRDETLRRQFVRAQSQAFPDGIPQERLLGIVALLNRYGPALVQRLMQELPLDTRHHTVLTL